MDDLTLINVSALKDCKSNFDNELNHFNNTSFQSFKDSYLNRCSDAYVSKMSTKLSGMYSAIETGYSNINKWWLDYNSNIEGLENTLSNDERTGNLELADIRNFINNKLQKLEDFNMTIAGIINPLIDREKDPVKFANNEVVTNFDQFADLYKDYKTDFDDKVDTNLEKKGFFSEVQEYVHDKTKSLLDEAKEKFQENPKEFIKDAIITGAKIAAIAGCLIGGSSKKEEINEPEDIFATFDNKLNEVKEDLSKNIEIVKETTIDASKEILDSVNNFRKDFTKLAQEKIIELSAATATIVTNGVESVSNKAGEMALEASNWASSVVNKFQDDPVVFLLDTLENTAATVSAVGNSLVEGVGQFGEAIVDFALIASTLNSTKSFLAADFASYISSNITGSEFKSLTATMWLNTQGIVSEEHVTNWYDNWYENGVIGSWTKNNAYGFENVRSVGSGVGYTAGVVALTILTAGVGGAAVGGGAAATSAGTTAAVTSSQLAVTATAAGIGKGTESAWTDGAGIAEGLATGTVSGLWEGVQWYIGGKIGSFNLTKGTGIDAKVVNSLSRVVLDSVDGALEGLAQPLIQTIYKDGYYDEFGNYQAFNSKDGILKRFNELFNDAGGVNNILTNAAVGGVSSSIGEVFDLNKILKNNSYGDANNRIVNELEIKNNFDVTAKIIPINKLQEILTNKELYEKYLDFDNNKEIFGDFTKAEYENGLKNLIVTNTRNDLNFEFNSNILNNFISEHNLLNILQDINNTKVKVDANGNPINKFEVFNTEGQQITNDYVENIETYLKQKITFEDYLQKQGIEIKRMNDYFELAETMGDGKLYLFSRLKELAATQQSKQLNDLFDAYSKMSVGNIDSNVMFDNIKQFLTEEEINTYLNLSKNGVSDKMASEYSYEQLASVFNYTSAGGFEINSWLNNTFLPGNSISTRTQYNSIDVIQNLCSGRNLGSRSNWEFRTDSGSIIDGLDSIIASAKYDDAIITYRGVQQLWHGDQILNLHQLKPGDSFSSAGYQSSSILLENNFSVTHDNSHIILEIIVPPKSGVAAYIENITGVKKWSQSEMIIKRNATMTVIGDVYQKEINGEFKVVVPVVVH